MALSLSPCGVPRRSLLGKHYRSPVRKPRCCSLTIWNCSIVGAFLVNLFIFPYHARTRYHKVVAQTLDTLGDLCKISWNSSR